MNLFNLFTYKSTRFVVLSCTALTAFSSIADAAPIVIGSGQTKKVSVADINGASGKVIDNGTLDIDGSGNMTSGALPLAISGAGRVVKTGDGTATFDTMPGGTYTGGTEVQSGTLEVNPFALGYGDIQIDTGANLTEVEGSNTAGTLLANNISGSGIVTYSMEAGTHATIVVTGDNTYTGGTVINNTTASLGRVVGNADSFGSGAITINKGATLEYNTGGHINTTSSGVTYTGVYGNDQRTGKEQDTLQFLQASDQVVSNTISGEGALQKAGTSTLTYVGNGTGFSGSLDVQEGTWNEQSATGLSAAVTIEKGAVFEGQGSIGSIDAKSGAVINATGNGFHVDGAAKLESGSTLVAGAGVGSSVSVISAKDGISVAGIYSSKSAVQADVDNTDGVNIQAENSFENESAAVDQTSLVVTGSRNSTSFQVLGGSGNEQAVEGALNSLSDNDATLQGVLHTGVTDAQIKAGMKSLDGEIHASGRSALIEDSYYIRNATLDRLDDILDNNGIHHGQEKHLDGPFDKVTAWAAAYGGLSHDSGNGNSNKMSAQSAGFIQGADLSLGHHWQLGAMLAYDRSMFGQQRGLSSSGRSNGATVGLYAGKSWGHFNLKGGVAYTWNLISESRQAQVGTWSNRLHSNYLGGTSQAFIEAGYKLHPFTHAVFEPFARGAYVHEQTDSYNEHGINGNMGDALHGKNTNSGVTYGVWGARGSYDFNIKGINFTARTLVGYRHAFEDTTPKIRQRFMTGGDDFTVAGADVSEDAALFNTGFDAHVNDRLSVGINYIGQYGTHQTSSGGQVRGKFNF